MKKCYMCKEEKEDEKFSKKKASKDGLQSRCSECMSKTMLIVYNKDRTTWNDRVKKQKGRKREWIDKIKQEKGCLICKESDPVCLEFHHKNPSTKEYNISFMACNCIGDERIKEEIEKCVVICANCHRKIHSGKIKI